MNKLWIPVIVLIGASCTKTDNFKALEDVRKSLIGTKGNYEVKAAPRPINMHTGDNKWEGVAGLIGDGYIQYQEKKPDSAITLYGDAITKAYELEFDAMITENQKKQIRNLKGMIDKLMGDSYSQKGDERTAKRSYESAKEEFERIGYKKGLEELEEHNLR